MGQPLRLRHIVATSRKCSCRLFLGGLAYFQITLQGLKRLVPRERPQGRQGYSGLTRTR